MTRWLILQMIWVALCSGASGWALSKIIMGSICSRLRDTADQYEIGDPLQRKCPGNAWVLRMIAFAIDGKDQPL